MANQIPAPQWTPSGIEPGPQLDALQRLYQQVTSLQAQVNAIPPPAPAHTPAPVAHSAPYAINGKPGGGQVTQVYTYTSKVNYPANFAGSQGSAATAATGNARFSIAKNGAPIGYVTATPANGFVFTTTGPQSFGPGDYMTITAPASADATLSDIHVNFAGTVAS